MNKCLKEVRKPAMEVCVGRAFWVEGTVSADWESRFIAL